MQKTMKAAVVRAFGKPLAMRKSPFPSRDLGKCW